MGIHFGLLMAPVLIGLCLPSVLPSRCGFRDFPLLRQQGLATNCEFM